MSLFRPVHWVRTHSFTSSLYWTVRSWLWNYPITPDYNVWDEGDPNEYDNFVKERRRTQGIWKFLEPYFAERGYTLYVQKDQSDVWAAQCPAGKMIDPQQLSYPYASEYYCKDEKELKVSPVAARVWPARDKDGRDVFIKAISGEVPRNELKALQLLHSEPLCNDPRNRTIPVIEYIEFNQQTFVVMPRWSRPIECDFVTVAETIRFARAYFEAVAFLHENNLTHGDFFAQNMCMDVIMPAATFHRYYTGYHTPERRYVLIDFDSAQIHTGSGPFSPDFERSRKRDIFFLAWTLSVYLRCIEHVIPAIVGLLDAMMEDDSPLTATAVLSRFEEICAGLTTDDPDLSVAAYHYSNGIFQYRNGPPANQPL